MKLKFPKTITIGDTEFDVKTDKESSGGEFYYYDERKKLTKGKIIIGTKLLKIYPVNILTAIIHELKEIIQNEQGTRYSCPTEKNSYEFHYNHKQHSDFCARLSQAISQFL